MSKETKQQRPPIGGMGPRMGGGPVQKPKNFKKTMHNLIDYLKPFHLSIIFVILLAIGGTVFSIVGPKVLGQATEKLFQGIIAKVSGTGSIDFAGIGRIILTLLVLYSISAIFSYIQYFIISGVSQKVSYNLRSSLASKINRLPFSYFDRVTHGEVLSRVTNDIDTLSNSLNQSMSQMITASVTLVGISIMMFSISWQMTLLAILVLPISMIFISFIVKRSQHYFKEQQVFLGSLNGHIEEMYGGHLIMKAFNGEQKSVHTFTGHNDNLYKTAWKSQFFSGLMMPIMQFVGNIGYVGICILGGYLAIRSKVSIGDIQAFIQYVRQFNQPIAQTAQIANVLQSTAAAAERIFDFLAEPEQLPETTSPKTVDHVAGSVTFENVQFGYLPEQPIIHNFSAHIQAGKKIAIVGPTGAGKTTIVKLLMRFYELQKGIIYIDGTDITEFTRSDLRSLFGMVLQDAWLFGGSIMENIRYGNLKASDDDVIHAADMAYVDHFIRTLEHGYQTVINEESTNISQGQKQLLTIARAFLADPKILILDEATSSVDTRTEILIQKGMANLMKDRTSFIIAHRLSTIRDADLILVMNAGDIVEVGSHDELLQRGGFYANLYQAQFQNEQEA